MTPQPESTPRVECLDRVNQPERHEAPGLETAPATSLSRQAFFRRMRGVTVTTLAAGSVGTALLSRTTRAWAQAAAMGPADLLTRRWQAYRLLQEVAMAQSNLPLSICPTNGDEAAYPTPIASFTKGLPHNALGEGERAAYAALRAALTTGQATAFEALPLGGQLPLANPQAAYAFALEGLDPHHVALPAPPGLLEGRDGRRDGRTLLAGPDPRRAVCGVRDPSAHSGHGGGSVPMLGLPWATGQRPRHPGDAVSGADAWRSHWPIPLTISLAGCALRGDDTGAAWPGIHCRRRLYDRISGLAQHPTRGAPRTAQCAGCDSALSPPRARLKRLCP
jgi:hypothetical protein